MSVLGLFWYMKPEECGQQQLFMATSHRFPPAKSLCDDETGVSLVGGLRPIKAINGKEGGGSYTVNEHGGAVNDKVITFWLAIPRTDGTQDTVWRHILDTLKRITGAERL
ncbi:hypothetical protein DPV78_006048 [Talaromyces pinophilus]|nr:hypothetical protein DPV78_006048 [Talaromyces pinophilus]